MRAFAAALLVMASPPSSAEPPPLRLDELLASVSERAPRVRVQAANVDVARANVGVAGAWDDLRISAMGSEIGTSDPMAQPMIRYQVSQPLTPLFGRRALAKDAARAQEAGAAAGLDRARLDARGQAFEAFYELWMNGEMASLIARQLAVMQRMRESARARYVSGTMMGHHELLRAEAEIAGMQAERASLTDERLAIVAMLNVLLARPSDSALGEPELPARAPLASIDELLSRVSGRPEVRASRAILTEMEARRGLTAAEYLPMVMVGAAVEQQFRMPTTVGFDVAFTIPVWWWDRQDNMRAMADAMIARAERDLVAMQAMTEAEVRTSWSRARAAERRLDVLEETALPTMRQTVASAESAYIAGSGDFLPFLDATLALRGLESDRLLAIVRRESASYALTRLLGPAVETRP
jgi:outer membrane protein TolC